MNTIETLGDANKAVLEQDKALRVQPKAPGPTEYYYIDNGWKKHICGHKHASNVDAETVRKAVKRGMNGVEPVRVVDKGRPEEYA